MKRRILSCFLVACIIATLVPTSSITVGAVLEENEAIYSVNVDTDGADNVIVAEYNGTSYVMGPIKEDGTAEAIPAVNRNPSGNDIVVNEAAAELFQASAERYTYSNGSYPVYSFLTGSGYIVDTYGIDSEEHKLAKSEKESVTLSDYPYFWRFDWTPGWYNWNSNYRIYLVVDGSNIYFKLGYGSPAEGVEYVKVNIFHKSCQHPNMQYVPAVPPTCKKDGNGEYWFCPDCQNAGYAPYFSDADGLNGMSTPPVSLSYGAVDNDHDGVCDDCGKNMPVFRPVTDGSQIVAGGKYILVAKTGGKYYAAATGSEQYAEELPAVELTPGADGSFTFESAVNTMTIELQFAHGHTEWGNGIRYGFLTKFNGSLSLIAPYGGFMFDEYDIRGAKYGFYVGLNEGGTAEIHSAFSESDVIRSYAKDESLLFTFTDYSADTSYTAAEVFLYRLTDTGTVGTNTYDMTAVKSETDYTAYNENGAAAEGGTNITGVPDALTQTAINAIVRTFVEGESIPGDANIQINTSVNVTVKSYAADSSITFSLMPTAVVSGGGREKSYDISDSDFDGITPMNVILYTGGIMPAQIIHEKQDGTNEYFYPEYSEKVMSDGEKPFYELYDNDGNMYVLFTVTEYSDVRLLAEPIAENVAVTGVTIDETLSVNIGETKTPVWTVSPAGATNRNVTFAIDDPSVATVNGTTGEVTGVKKGTAILTVKTVDGNFTDTCTVTVSCPHTNKTDVSEKASTCKTPGWGAYKRCVDCGQLFKTDGTTEISVIPYRPLSTEHTGGKATCMEKAKCSVCDAEYGSFADHNWTPATCTTPKTCSVCETTEGSALGHSEGTEWKSDANNHWHICTVADCGVVIESSKAAHTASDWITDTQATADTDGTKHKECVVCRRVLETGTIPATGSGDLPPQIIEGEGTKVTSGGNVELSFRSDAAFSDFIRVEIDGKTLDAKHYTVKEGSTIVTLNGDYVATLSVGEHTIGVVSASGTATATFAVETRQQTTDPANPTNPQPSETGDNSRMALWVAVLFVSGVGVAGTAICSRKKKYSAK